MRTDDGVGGQDQSGFTAFTVVDLGRVDMQSLFGGRLQDIFEGGKGFGKVFGEGAGDDVEAGQADLSKELAPSW